MNPFRFFASKIAGALSWGPATISVSVEPAGVPVSVGGRAGPRQGVDVRLCTVERDVLVEVRPNGRASWSVTVAGERVEFPVVREIGPDDFAVRRQAPRTRSEAVAVGTALAAAKAFGLGLKLEVSR